MSKELTPLEAWKELKNQYKGLISNTDIPKLREDEKQRLKVIESALKEQEQDQKLYDKITRVNLELGQENCRLNELVNKQLNDLSKLDTFIEIIKHKGCSYMEIALIVSCDNYEEYCIEMDSGRVYSSGYECERACKTQEEYDLLREVLLWK